MKITQEEMISRQRIAKLRSDLTDVVGSQIEGLTYAEVLVALSECITAWVGYQWRDELKEALTTQPETK